MADDNKPMKYMRYAFGEIALVVIGILIALQINTWNEERKLKSKERKSLTELRKDLNQNLNDISVNIINLRECKKSNEIIIFHIENNLAYNDSLDYHFSMLYPFISFTINQTTYETLKQGGIDLISNDSLRNSISNLYSVQFKAYQTFENTYMVNHYLDYIKPMFISEFVTYKFGSSAHPKNYDHFILNSGYKQVLNFTIDICNNYIRMQSNLKTEVERIIDIVDKEVND
ncbi:DUF6090 family protein [Lutimonas vermicola]|uniref:DUF6090 family protein n=1 Tax=Lutimonas vermicola TaxID=414288 RepID=A0ABU9L320_9FLAO